MQAETFGATAERRGGVAVIRLHGEFNGFSGVGLNAAYEEATADGPSAVLLDFESIGYINSTGIALVVELLRRSREQGRRLLACGLSEHYQQIFQITRLADYVALFADEESALAALERSAATSQEVSDA